MRWNRLGREEEADGEAEKEEERKSHAIVVTDACLPLVASVELPVCARILINYELPTKKVYFLNPCFRQWLVLFSNQKPLSLQILHS